MEMHPEEGHVKTACGAAMGVRQPQAEEGRPRLASGCQQLAEARDTFYLRASRRTQPRCHIAFGLLASPTVRE